jgi:hypothetical protein
MQKGIFSEIDLRVLYSGNGISALSRFTAKGLMVPSKSENIAPICNTTR